MKRYGNLYDRLCDPENLELALKRAIDGKKWRRVIQKTLVRKDEVLVSLHKMLEAGTYHTSPYHSKVVYEPKERTIYSLPFYPDRIVHHAIMNVLEPIWDRQLDYDCFSCRKDKGCLAGSMRCMSYVRTYKYVLQCDISKFYPSIDHSIVKEILRKKIKDQRMLILLDEIIDSSNSIPEMVKGKNAPIGNLLSQWLGNLYLTPMDRWVRQEKKIHQYVRYCDDFLFFSNDKEELRRIQQELPVFLAEKLKLSLSKSRLYRTSQGVDFLGYRHFPKYILVRKRTAKKVKKFVRGALAVEFRNVVRTQGRAGSYKGLLKHANTYNFRQSMHFNEMLCMYGVRPL